MICKAFLSTIVLAALFAVPLFGCKQEPSSEIGRPATSTVTEPAKKPADRPPAPATGKHKSPYWGFKVGDMVKLRGGSGKTAITMVQEVTKVDDTNVHVKKSTIAGGQTIPVSETPFPLYQAFKPTPTGGGEKVAQETLTIGGQQVKCEVWELKRPIPGGKTVTVKTWTSDRLLGGVAKSMSDSSGSMQVNSEVVDFKSSK